MKADPGWYPDPRQQGMMRFWDGRRWTKTVARAAGAPVAAHLDVPSESKRLRDPFTGELRWRPGDTEPPAPADLADPGDGATPDANRPRSSVSAPAFGPDPRVSFGGLGAPDGAAWADEAAPADNDDEDDHDDDVDVWANRRRRSANRVPETTTDAVGDAEWTPPAHLVEQWAHADARAAAAAPEDDEVLRHLASHPIGLNLPGGYLRCDGVTLTFAGVEHDVARSATSPTGPSCGRAWPVAPRSA